MKKQFLVVGLGNFGYYLATTLYNKGHEIMAVDKNPDLVQTIKNKVTQAIVADAADASIIRSLAVQEMDAGIVSIGSVLSDSILAVLNLQEAGMKHIIAKAINESHKRVLEKLNIQDILFPEKDIATSTAERLHNPNLIDYLPFMEGYRVIERVVPKQFIGKTLRQINLTNRFEIQVIAIKEMVPEKLHFIPKADFVLKISDILFYSDQTQGWKKLNHCKYRFEVFNYDWKRKTVDSDQ